MAEEVNGATQLAGLLAEQLVARIPAFGGAQTQALTEFGSKRSVKTRVYLF